MRNVDPWAREAVRVYRRYQLEIVEACGLCPWAERARRDGRVRERVILGEPFGEALAYMAELAADEEVEIGLLLFPKLALDRRHFDRFIAKLQNADRARYVLGRVPFMFAAFHPDAAADLSDPERLIPFLRRTPDPTIQLVRASVVDRMRSRVPQGTQFFDPSRLEAPPAPADSGPELREKIAQTNMATVKRMGVEELRAKLDDILRDRNETYRALAP